MSRKKITTSVLFALLVVVPSIARGGMDAEEIQETLRRASAEAISIPKQADALAFLAWPKDGPADAGLESAARERLVRFGHNGLAALRKALSRVDSLYTADVTAALIAARWRVSAGDPAEFLPGLSDALWYGSADAQRLAMLEMSRFRFSSAVSGIIDAAQAHPELTRAAIGSMLPRSGPQPTRPRARTSTPIEAAQRFRLHMDETREEDPATMRRRCVDGQDDDPLGCPSMSDTADRARNWLNGDHRTWRWNEGSYEGKNRYDAVETSADGLVWFGWDVAAGGATERTTQSYAGFLDEGPAADAPESILAELRAWIAANQR